MRLSALLKLERIFLCTSNPLGRPLPRLSQIRGRFERMHIMDHQQCNFQGNYSRQLFCKTLFTFSHFSWILKSAVRGQFWKVFKVYHVSEIVFHFVFYSSFFWKPQESGVGSSSANLNDWHAFVWSCDHIGWGEAHMTKQLIKFKGDCSDHMG